MGRPNTGRGAGGAGGGELGAVTARTAQGQGRSRLGAGGSGSSGVLGRPGSMPRDLEAVGRSEGMLPMGMHPGRRQSSPAGGAAARGAGLAVRQRRPWLWPAAMCCSGRGSAVVPAASAIRLPTCGRSRACPEVRGRVVPGSVRKLRCDMRMEGNGAVTGHASRRACRCSRSRADLPRHIHWFACHEVVLSRHDSSCRGGSTPGALRAGSVLERTCPVPGSPVHCTCLLAAGSKYIMSQIVLHLHRCHRRAADQHN